MGDIKIFDLAKLIDEFNIKTFCETGTLHGDAVEYVRSLSNTDNIISIEIIPQLAAKAKLRFETDDRVKIICDDSSKAMYSICNNINTNALFWLDAHFPGADCHMKKYDDEQRAKTRTPLKTELQNIYRRRVKYRDVIIIDDLWLYEHGPFEWGTFNEHMEKYHNGIKREDICKESSAFIYEMFESSHDIKRIPNHQGYLLITPKKHL